MIELYTDGSAIHNPGPGGWGAILVGLTENPIELSGCEAESTNNRMELQAVISGLQWLLQDLDIERDLVAPHTGLDQGLFATEKQGGSCDARSYEEPVHIYTDSTYVQKGMTEWMPTWIRRNRRKSKGGQLVKNADLWKQLNAVVAKFDQLEWSWVKAHAGHVMNERVDDLAREAAIRQ